MFISKRQHEADINIRIKKIDDLERQLDYERDRVMAEVEKRSVLNATIEQLKIQLEQLRLDNDTLRNERRQLLDDMLELCGISPMYRPGAKAPQPGDPGQSMRQARDFSRLNEAFSTQMFIEKQKKAAQEAIKSETESTEN